MTPRNEVEELAREIAATEKISMAAARKQAQRQLLALAAYAVQWDRAAREGRKSR